MIVTVAATARPVDFDTFADITTKQVIGVDWFEGALNIQFAVNLTADETRLVRIRCLTSDAATETLLRDAAAAHTTGAGYLALPAPTTAQALAQVAALRRDIQLLLRALAPID